MNANQQKYQKASSEAQAEFNQKRVQKLCMIWFPQDKLHPNFKNTLQKLLRYNSAKQMMVLDITWLNMCTFNRDFFIPEMEVCMEILLRATPNEIFDENDFVDFENKTIQEYAEKDKTLTENELFLMYYNQVSYPKIMEIVKPMKEILTKIDQEISEKIAAEINSKKKIELQIPIGQNIKFINTSITG